VSSASPSPWWRPESHADRRPFLLARNRIKAAFRAWFEAEGFLEVETAALQVSPGNEAHLHAFETRALTLAGEAAPLYLHTSPEFSCKKLLAAGETRIFDFGKVWRNRERGALHHPEFTMLEWYRVDAPYQVLMDDCAALLALAGGKGGNPRIPLSEPCLRSLRRAPAGDGGGGLRPLRRRRPAGLAGRGRRDRPRRPGRRGPGVRGSASPTTTAGPTCSAG
jgi:elongation factor P--beta-lysine ligase